MTSVRVGITPSPREYRAVRRLVSPNNRAVKIVPGRTSWPAGPIATHAVGIFDTIKIDQSFVRTTSRGTRPVILKSIIALAHDLGMDVVAEGAETDSDAVELYQLGCEYAQGFAFGEPMDADAAMRLLTEERLEAAS
jgi:hypothetical protein